jgi:hypothetical protein
MLWATATKAFLSPRRLTSRRYCAAQALWKVRWCE